MEEFKETNSLLEPKKKIKFIVKKVKPKNMRFV